MLKITKKSMKTQNNGIDLTLNVQIGEIDHVPNSSPKKTQNLEISRDQINQKLKKCC